MMLFVLIINSKSMSRENYLKKQAKLKGISIRQLSELLPIKEAALGVAFRRGKVQSEYLDVIEDFLKVEPYNNTINNQIMSFNENPEITTKDKGVPYYDVDFLGGFDGQDNDQTLQPSFYINHPQYNDADYWVNVTGKSMSPFISHGDLIAVKEEKGWNKFLLGGEIYAIVTDSFRTVKKVRVDQGKDYITLVPHNKSAEFTEQQLPKELIRSVFRVQGCIKRFF